MPDNLAGELVITPPKRRSRKRRRNRRSLGGGQAELMLYVVSHWSLPLVTLGHKGVRPTGQGSRRNTGQSLGDGNDNDIDIDHVLLDHLGLVINTCSKAHPR